MKKRNLIPYAALLSLLLCRAAGLQAQMENNTWVGSLDVQIRFANGYPEQVITPAPATGNIVWRSSTSVSGSAGQLLFYTNGREIRNRNYGVTPNGYLATIAPGASTSDDHHVTIVPFSSDTNKFYVFYMAANLSWTLRYSVVDMTLNGGLGDIVTGQKDILLDQGLTGHLGVVAGNNCDFWLVVHDQFSNGFKAYRIDASGISGTPVLTHVGTTPGTYIQGLLCFSPDRKRMAMSMESGPGAQLFRFDPTTGIMSQPMVLNNTASATALCFSPDNSRLYVIGGTPLSTTSWWPPLWQFTLNDPAPAAINASQTFISDSLGNNYNRTTLMPGPDGKIYATWNDTYFNDYATLSRIDFPNLTGTACHLVTQYMTIYNNQTPPTSYNAFSGSWQLHNMVPRIFRDTLYSRYDTTLCAGAAWAVAPAGDSITWNDGSHAGTRLLSAEGRYIVHYKPSCHWQTDTFVLQVKDVFGPFSLGPDTLLCTPATVVLAPSFPDSSTHTWSDGSTGPALTVNDAGTYAVRLDKGGCSLTDSITLRVAALQFDLGSFPVQCKGTELVLDPRLTGSDISYTWQDNSHDARFSVTGPGRYWLQVTEGACTYSDTVNIAYENCDCPVQIPNAFSPNNDGLNDVFRPGFACGDLTGYALDIFNRWGARVFQSLQYAKGWDGTYQDKPADSGTYFFQLRYTNKKGKQEYHKGTCLLMR